MGNSEVTRVGNKLGISDGEVMGITLRVDKTWGLGMMRASIIRWQG